MKELKINKNIYFVLISIFLLVVVVELAFLFRGNLSSSKEASESTLVKYADDIVKLCAEERYRPACYDREIPKLMDLISMEDAFKVTKVVQGQDSSYPYCHVLGHELSAREVKKDPSAWKEVVTRCPAGMCSNGCLHGGFQERFRAESFTDEEIEVIKPELAMICEARGTWKPTGLEQASCYHAVGHLTMYLTDADIDRANKICEHVAIKPDGRSFIQTCTDGVYMQMFQPLEPEDFALIEGKEIAKEELEAFCRQYEGQQRMSCWREGWPLYGSEIRTPEGLMKHCSNPVLSSQAGKEQCFGALFYVITVQLEFNLEKMQDFCSALPEDRMSQCFGGTASRLIETDYRNISKVVDYCASAPTTNSQASCYEELIKYSTFNFHAGSAEFYELCNGLPLNWKNKCLVNAPRQ